MRDNRPNLSHDADGIPTETDIACLKEPPFSDDDQKRNDSHERPAYVYLKTSSTVV